MARTGILPTDPVKRKAWSATVNEDSYREQYFNRLLGPEGSRSAGIRKTDTQKGATDEIVTALVSKFRGPPIIEGQKLAGREFRLQHAAHTMRINEFRHGVNVGARIEQSRVGFNLKRQGREAVTGYIKELYEEVIVMAASGARGVGDEIQHHDVSYAGYPNALRTPDTAHYFVGTDNSKVKATLTTSDKVTLATLSKLRTKAKKMLGGQPDKAVKITPVMKGGKECFIFAALPEVVQDIRDDVGAQGWFEAQKALITAIGKEAEFFKGGAGMFNGVLVDEMETGVKFSDFGSGANVNAARSLFMGANFFAVAHGTKGQDDGMTIVLDEDTDDRKHDQILFFEMIFGADKCTYNSMDYGGITVDTAYSSAV